MTSAADAAAKERIEVKLPAFEAGGKPPRQTFTMPRSVGIGSF
jgi:hypothetical protein